MSENLVALTFPLHGSRLIEASAGTGKTWTIAALYLRLVLGHGGPHAHPRPLLPSEILVMTFTRAATRELSNRIRERLVQAAAYFRGEPVPADPYLEQLAADYPAATERQQAAYRLMLAAETMDEAAIFTIDSWCQRMLREHAFDSGSLFDEELVGDERALFEDASHDYWRQQVYSLDDEALVAVLDCWADVGVLKRAVRDLVPRWQSFGAPDGEPLADLVGRLRAAHLADLARLKQGWAERADQMERWIAQQRERNPKAFNGNMMRAASVPKWFDALRAWAGTPAMEAPEINDTAWKRLAPEGLREAFANGFSADIPACFDATADLREGLAQLQPLKHALLRHAARHIALRMAELKRRDRQFGFADMLHRLRDALEGANGAALQRRIVAQYPVALVDEFQDTSPEQYRIFDLLYRIAANDPALGLFMIGDPKQSIYGFRGADIHSYLAARRATEGRHYRLGTNFRSTLAIVRAVNRLFAYAEERQGSGAFRFRNEHENPLPFDAVDANGRKERLVGVDGPYQALAVCCFDREAMKADAYLDFFAGHCAEHIVGLLNDRRVGFDKDGAFRRLQPADIAVLVRNRKEAGAIRRALQQRKVASVYLSDKESVFRSEEARDMLRWLRAVSNPLDGRLARAAFATSTARLPLSELVRQLADEAVWEERVEQLKALHITWQRQGVLAMLRRFVHELGLPALLLAETGGERRLTNVLHLAELLQGASRELDGEQALVRWFAEQVQAEHDGGDERVLRLESDAELVKVVTVHKSKGLEYPLVFLPFAVSTRKVDKKRSFVEFVDAGGVRQLDLGLAADAMEMAERARLAEDLRLLYVALTRASHFLWMGVATLGKAPLHESALGYILGGGDAIPAAALCGKVDEMRGAIDDIELHRLDEPEGCTMLDRVEDKPELAPTPLYDASFERDWSVGSFTSIARQASAAPVRAQDETLLEEPDAAPLPAAVDDLPWHRFPRGSVPGNFLHEQLEWMAQEGFAIVHEANFDSRFTLRCERSGWANRKDDALAWLRVLTTTTLPPLGAALADIVQPLPEMEFWFPSERLAVGELDRACRERLLGGIERPVLPERELHGMLKGFADLVFEHEGRYWVLDYKSNALGVNDAAYTRRAMAAAMAGHRYDIQGAIYMLALHRLLRSRLGEAYDPARQLGGAVFLFLRGIGNPATRGCCLLEPDIGLLDRLDQLLGMESA